MGVWIYFDTASSRVISIAGVLFSFGSTSSRVISHSFAPAFSLRGPTTKQPRECRSQPELLRASAGSLQRCPAAQRYHRLRVSQRDLSRDKMPYRRCGLSRRSVALGLPQSSTPIAR